MPTQTEITPITLESLLSGITSAAKWLWTIFADLVEVVMSNPLFYLPVLFALASGGIMLAVKIVKSFGMRGKGGKKGGRRRKK